MFDRAIPALQPFGHARAQADVPATAAGETHEQVRLALEPVDIGEGMVVDEKGAAEQARHRRDHHIVDDTGTAGRGKIDRAAAFAGPAGDEPRHRREHAADAPEMITGAAREAARRRVEIDHRGTFAQRRREQRRHLGRAVDRRRQGPHHRDLVGGARPGRCHRHKTCSREVPPPSPFPRIRSGAGSLPPVTRMRASHDGGRGLRRVGAAPATPTRSGVRGLRPSTGNTS